MSAALSQTNGGLTYVDVAFSLANHFKFAAVQNRAGKFQIPGLNSIKAAGATILRVAPNNGGISIQIRGPSSFYGSNEPLYIIDETPITAAPGGVLIGINPHDIESIKVLKDPAETGVYGMRGANGVILITTKRRRKSS